MDGSDRTKLVDMNGDGRTDLARITSAGVNYAQVCISQAAAPASFTVPCSNWTLPSRAVPSQYDEIFADFNGDGLGDLAILNASSGSSSFVCFTNSAGNGFASCKTASQIPNRTSGIRLWGDVDGNGQIDLLHYQGNGLWTVCLSQPEHPTNAFACQGNLQGPTGGVGDNVQYHVFVGDFNGDGRADIIGRKSDSSSSDQWKVCYSAFTAPNAAGNGWSCPQAPSPDWVQAAGGDLDRLTVLDFNGDGLADMAARDPAPNYAGRWRVCLSAGDGSFDYRTTDNPQYPLSEPRCKYWSGPDKDVNDVQFGDFNGDGRTDLVVHRGSGYWELYVSTGTDFVSLGWWSAGIVPQQSVAVATLSGAVVYLLALYLTRPPAGYGFSDAAWLMVTGAGAIVPSCILFSVVRRHASRLRWPIALGEELLASILLAALTGFIFESFVSWGLQSLVSAKEGLIKLFEARFEARLVARAYGSRT